jgi:threonine aldolase
MIDLRSDNLPIASAEMCKTMYEAEVGDEGGMGSGGKGEDPTVNRLEDIAAQLTGKEGAIFVPSATMGNLAACQEFKPVPITCQMISPSKIRVNST